MIIEQLQYATSAEAFILSNLCLLCKNNIFLIRKVQEIKFDYNLNKYLHKNIRKCKKLVGEMKK